MCWQSPEGWIISRLAPPVLIFIQLSEDHGYQEDCNQDNRID
jgi:hypothetical protein